MKKSELVQLVNSEDGTLPVSRICYLRKWTCVVPGGRKVGRLALDFTAINGIGRIAGSVEINSRDYHGIVGEIEAAIKERLNELADYLCSAIRNGYTP